MTPSTIKHLETLFDVGTLSGAPDGSLLEQFAKNRDAVAFEAIVARHSSMVFNVCRRMLREQGDVEDAFQATFLILVRKAGTLRDRERLRTWLYGVARRVASRARSQKDRRRSREQRLFTSEPSVDSPREVERRELFAVLDDELSRLPEKHRSAIVLCDLEGLTYEQAARNLECPLGTLKTRLTSGRKRLRERLIRRGIAPATATLAAGLAGEGANAAVPAKLAASTVGAALQYALTRAAAFSAVSPSVSILTEGVLTTMRLFRLKLIGSAAFLVIAPCAVALGVFAQPASSKYDEQIRQLEERLKLLKNIRSREIELERSRENTQALQASAIEKLRKLNATVDRDVVAVNLAGTTATDDDMIALRAFPNLTTLHLHHTKVGDAGLANLKGLKYLRTLDLFDTRVTDQGLEHLLESLPRLERLELSDTGVTDACLKSFIGLRQLRLLDVRKTKVTEAAVEQFRRWTPGVEVLR
jgi:RNA polymerase sigma factor (sigma-70 family)